MTDPLSDLADLFLSVNAPQEAPKLRIVEEITDLTDVQPEYDPAADNNRPPKDNVLKVHDTGDRKNGQKGIMFQRCGGGRRIIRKRITN